MNGKKIIKGLKEAMFELASSTVKWKHKKRGTTYIAIGLASLKCETPPSEGTLLVVYQEEDGHIWARPYDEFLDGRFEMIDENYEKRNAISS